MVIFRLLLLFIYFLYYLLVSLSLSYIFWFILSLFPVCYPLSTFYFFHIYFYFFFYFLHFIVSLIPSLLFLEWYIVSAFFVCFSFLYQNVMNSCKNVMIQYLCMKIIHLLLFCSDSWYYKSRLSIQPHFGIRKVVFVCSFSVGVAGCLLLTLILAKSSLFVVSVWGWLVAYCSLWY